MDDEPKGVEELISAAVACGEFDNLPGTGRPLDLDEYFRAPEDLRMVYSILKGGGFVPEEVQLLKTSSAHEELKTCRTRGGSRQCDARQAARHSLNMRGRGERTDERGEASPERGGTRPAAASAARICAMRGRIPSRTRRGILAV